MDFLASFMGSPVRARIMRSIITCELRAMTKEQIAKLAGVSASVVGREIRVFAQAGVLKKVRSIPVLEVAAKPRHKKRTREEGWSLDTTSSYARALSVFVHEVSPAQYRDMEQALKKTGRLSTIILSGMFVGDPSRPADLVVAGESLNEAQIERVVKLFEPKFGHEIRYAAFSTPEFKYRLNIQDRLLRDILDFPHHTLLHKGSAL